MTEELDRYIREHSEPEPENLRELYRQTNIALINGRMCSGHLQGRFLKMLMQMIRPQRVLELGTFSGYSALCMAEGLPEGGIVVSVEADDELEDFIREHLELSPWGSRVEPVFADALDYCRCCEPESFDVAFIDADKRRYSDYFEAVLPLVRPGGFIIADNTLWDGHVVEAGRKKDPQTRGIMEFNDLAARDERVETVMLPLRDGLTLMRKKP